MGHGLYGSAHPDQVAAEARRLRPGIETRAVIIRTRSAPGSAVVGHFVAHLRREVPRLVGG